MIMSRVKEIIEHERLADQAQATADDHRWEAARLIVAELATGKTKAQLGRDIGKTEAHVRYMARTSEAKLKFGAFVPPFNAVYNSPEVRGSIQVSDHSNRVAEIIKAQNDGDHYEALAEECRHRIAVLRAEEIRDRIDALGAEIDMRCNRAADLMEHMSETERQAVLDIMRRLHGEAA
jgi:predicted transcriptional regulator